MDRVLAEWKRFTEGLPLEGCLRSVILESWQRSRTAGVKPTTDRIILPRVADAEVQRWLAENSELLVWARPHLDGVSASLAQVPHVFCLTDRDGIVLYATGDRSQLERLGFVPGSDWSERAVGTNGAGTALAANLPVAIVGPEHFSKAFHDRTCTGAPLHAPNGQVIAAINLNTSRTNGNPERLAWVAHLAHVIDQELAYREETARERGRMEQALHDSEERHRIISELTADFTYAFRVGPDGTLDLESVSDGFTTVIGYTLEEFNARGGWAVVVHPDDMPVALRSQEKLLAGVSDASEIRTVSKNGEVRWLRYLSRPVWEAVQGRVVRIYGAAQDITERKQLEEELRQRLEQLAQADRRKDEFLAMLAHELRNPLDPVRNGLQIIKQLGREDTVVEKVRTIMERQVQHLTRLVDDLLDVARITHGKFQLRKEWVILSAVVIEAVEISRPLIDGRQQELTVLLPPQPFRLETDPARLTQIMTNLLDNAARSTGKRGRIWLTAAMEGNDIVLKVRDTGKGIPAEMLARIFEPFEEANREPGGLGIGLTLVRRLVELHGGTVEAFSAGPGQGSELVVRLPVFSEHPPGDCLRTEKRGIQPVVVPPKRHILVVDDNVDAAKSLAMLLRLEGHEVRVAYSGPKAVELAQEEPPELILLDLGMPDMDGYEVAQQLRKRPALENVRLVAMTGYGREEDRRRSREAGFDHHLVKPVEPEAFHQLLAQP